jgi:hypothetical protein
VADDALSLAHQHVRHSDWEVWLAEYCDLSARTARVYMSLARNRETIDSKRQRAAAAGPGHATQTDEGPAINKLDPVKTTCLLKAKATPKRRGVHREE